MITNKAFILIVAFFVLPAYSSQGIIDFKCFMIIAYICVTVCDLFPSSCRPVASDNWDRCFTEIQLRPFGNHFVLIILIFIFTSNNPVLPLRLTQEWFISEFSPLFGS